MNGTLPRRRAVTLVVLLALSVISTPADDPVSGEFDPFPELDAIRPNVDFWTRVFSDWTLGQAVIHDLKYPAVIYEIVDLPGEIGEAYTAEQRDWLEALRDDWEGYLRDLERKVSAGTPRDDIDKEWVLHIATTVGSDKLEGAHKRVRSQRGLRERFRAGLERSFRFDRVIRDILSEHGLPEDLAFLPHVESSFQYLARSSAGAQGIWQFTRGTGKHYLTINSAIDERLDPIAATRGAAGYLKDAYEKLGTWPLALTSYNHGVNGMMRAKGRFGTDFERIFREYDGRLFGFASKNFYAEFLAARRIASDPDTYFPEGYTPEPELDLDSVVLDRRVTPDWISSHYEVALDELASLNPGWSRRAVRSGLRLPEGTEVWLPKGTLERATGETGAATMPGGPADGAFYTVRPGDTLSTIAASHGIRLTRLRELNDLSDQADLIREGQRLRVHAAPAETLHVVHRGETLSEIARDYGMRLSDLRRYNDLGPRESTIHAGQKLRVSAGHAERLHVVKRGETLSEIARTYGVRLSDLRRYNDLGPRESTIHAGQKLRLDRASEPTRSARHVVRRGDTLSRIASRHGIALIDLLAANALSTRSVIHPGQILRIPD
jgi:membrane-bound lytic murein transglycosylase D